jgi:predicted N-acyltransferase
MPDNILLVIAERAGKPIAASLVIHDADTLYGRYWGALEHVPCLHFESGLLPAAGILHRAGHRDLRGRRPGRAQDGARLPADRTWSAHWLAHPAFADAIERFLERERGGIETTSMN